MNERICKSRSTSLIFPILNPKGFNIQAKINAGKYMIIYSVIVHTCIPKRNIEEMYVYHLFLTLVKKLAEEWCSQDGPLQSLGARLQSQDCLWMHLERLFAEASSCLITRSVCVVIGRPFILMIRDIFSESQQC